MNRKHVALSFIAIMVGLTAYSIFADKKPDPVPQDMNDRIIAQTSKCVAAGMEASVEERYSTFGSGDQFFVVCKTPRISNLERLAQQMEQDTQRKEEKRRKVENPDGFEAKSKRTE